MTEKVMKVKPELNIIDINEKDLESRDISPKVTLFNKLKFC